MTWFDWVGAASIVGLLVHHVVMRRREARLAEESKAKLEKFAKLAFEYGHREGRHVCRVLHGDPSKPRPQGILYAKTIPSKALTPAQREPLGDYD